MTETSIFDELLNLADLEIEADRVLRDIVALRIKHIFGELRTEHRAGVRLVNGATPERVRVGYVTLLDVPEMRYIARLYGIPIDDHLKKEVAGKVLVELRRAAPHVEVLESLKICRLTAEADERIRLRPTTD